MTTFSPSPESWDAFVLAQPRAHVLQLSAWGALKSAYGWRAERIALNDDGRIVAGAQVLFRALPYRLGTMAYVPMGPYVAHDADARTTFALYNGVWEAVRQAARRQRAAFVKWEPGIAAPGEPLHPPAAFGFRESPQTVQPPRTVLIDLTCGEDAILARMNQGTRRKIRQSQKNGVRCYEAQRGDVGKFTALMQTTGARNAFGVHEPGYYEKAYDLFVPQHAALILAEHEGEALAGVMVFAAGKTAWYLYGASSDVKRNLMASYGAQWAAVQWARARGCTVYDMWGVPDADEATLEAQFETRDDGLWGVYGFKRGWGGSVVRSPGAWDGVYNLLIYTAYRWALRRRGGDGAA